MRLVILVCVAALQGVRCQCPRDGQWTSYNRACYYVSGRSDARDWTASKANCEGRGARLVSLTSPEETNHITNVIRASCSGESSCLSGDNRLWIGLTNTNNLLFSEDKLERRKGYSWIDGYPYDWQNWYDGDGASDPQPSPNLGYVSMSLTGQWYSQTSGTQSRYICEQNAVPTSRLITVSPRPTYFTSSKLSTTYRPPLTHNVPVITTRNQVDTEPPGTSTTTLFTSHGPSDKSTTIFNGGITVSTTSNSSYNDTSKGSTGRSSNNDSTYIAIGVILPLVIIAAIATALFLLWRRKRNASSTEHQNTDVDRWNTMTRSTPDDNPVYSEEVTQSWGGFVHSSYVNTQNPVTDQATPGTGDDNTEYSYAQSGPKRPVKESGLKIVFGFNNKKPAKGLTPNRRPTPRPGPRTPVRVKFKPQEASKVKVIFEDEETVSDNSDDYDDTAKDHNKKFKPHSLYDM